MSKQLLIEASEFLSPIVIDKSLKESISIENNDDVLIVRNIPATIADRKNQNGRIYSTEVLQEAIKNAKFNLNNKWMYSQADEHPEGSFVAPTHASHVVINAYIKKNVKMFVEGKTEVHNVMFMDWEILNTVEGKNLKALILQETACPTSIRGLGDMEGNRVVNYELLGCDIVSNPSSGTSFRMPVEESVKVESFNKKAIDESFEVVTNSSDVVADIEASAQKQVDIENAKYGTLTNIKTKLDQEIDPNTGATTLITTIEAETTDEMSDLSTALQMAKNAFVNPVSKISSVTINFVDDEDKKKESIEKPENEIKEEDESMPNIELGMDDAEPADTTVPDEVEVGEEGGEIETSDSGSDNGTEESTEESAEENTEEPVEESVEESSIVSDLRDSISKLNDEIANEADSEKLKSLTKDRDDLEKLLIKKITPKEEEKEEPVEEAEIVNADENGATIELDKDELATIGANSVKQDPNAALSNPEEQDTAFENCEKEKLYTNPDEPSDPVAQQPLEDSEEEIVEEPQYIKVVLSNIDYNITDPENINSEDEEIISLLNNEETIKLSLNDIPEEGDIKDAVIRAAEKELGFSIKNADIKSVTLDLIEDEPQEIDDSSEEIKEDGEKEYRSFSIYGFSAGQMKDQYESTDKDESIRIAQRMAQLYYSRNEPNMEIIVVGITPDGVEDYDNLIYSYPENINSEDEEDTSMYDPEELPDDRDYGLEDTLAMYHNAGIDG